jgi:hypothetical protein
MEGGRVSAREGAGSGRSGGMAGQKGAAENAGELGEIVWGCFGHISCEAAERAAGQQHRDFSRTCFRRGTGGLTGGRRSSGQAIDGGWCVECVRPETARWV